MTSQSPTGTEATDEYEQAWASIQELTRTQGVSWSGGEQNHLFLNDGAGTFYDVSAVSHADFSDDGRAVATNLENPDFAAVARAMGAEGTLVEEVAQIGDALRAAIAEAGYQVS